MKVLLEGTHNFLSLTQKTSLVWQGIEPRPFARTSRTPLRSAYNSDLHFILMQNSIIAKYMEINQMVFNFLGEVIRYQFFISFLCFCLEKFVPAIKAGS